jgi:hypothetical protein
VIPPRHHAWTPERHATFPATWCFERKSCGSHEMKVLTQ